MTEMASDYCDCYLLHYILEAVLLYYRIVKFVSNPGGYFYIRLCEEAVSGRV